ncbi:hypothetical protein GCM10027610_106540 [Dactylosporangium cerinum]
MGADPLRTADGHVVDLDHDRDDRWEDGNRPPADQLGECKQHAGRDHALKQHETDESADVQVAKPQRTHIQRRLWGEPVARRHRPIPPARAATTANTARSSA